MMKAKSSKRYNNIDFRGGMSRRTCLSFRNDLHLDRIKSFTLVHGSTCRYRGVFEGFLQNILKEAKSNYLMELCHNSLPTLAQRAVCTQCSTHTHNTPRSPDLHFTFHTFYGCFSYQESTLLPLLKLHA